MHLELVEQRSAAEDPPLPTDVLRSLVRDLGRAQWWLNLVLVDDLHMADLNRRWYGGQGPTDVLSFSYLETEGHGEPDLSPGVGGAPRPLWVAPGEAVEPIVAGEVIIAPAFVASRCAAEGWDLRSEWALLQVHGALHVLGWTHETDERREAMRRQEAEVLGRDGIQHPLPPLGGER